MRPRWTLRDTPTSVKRTQVYPTFFDTVGHGCPNPDQFAPDALDEYGADARLFWDAQDSPLEYNTWYHPPEAGPSYSSILTFFLPYRAN